MKNLKLFLSISLLSFFLICNLKAQVVNVGSGSYTKTFPGTDIAGRNGYPTGTPNLVGNAVGKPVPTNDWWSALLKENHASNLFSYPYTLKTVNSGLVVSYIPFGVIDDMLPITVGVTGISAAKTNVADYTDWTVTMDWNDGTHNFQATAGIAMPFLYFTKKTTDVAQITVVSGSVTIDNEMMVITDAKNGADFAVYAPVGSTWVKNGNVYTSTLNGKNYWSMAFIPLTATNVTTVANEYKKYAYVFPANTTSSFNYNETTSVVRTEFTVQTDVKEGTENKMLLGLLPHQWANIASNSPVPDQYSYASIRGEIKTLAGNSFSVENKFHGILATLPYVDNYSAGFSPTELTQKITSIENDALELWTDSYNEGQVMNRLIQTARIADEMGNTVARDKMIATVKERLEDWLKAEGGEVAFLFYYNTTWSALLGYPAGHGQDTNINDHHFHWGYFIHAAAFLEQYKPGWASQFGEMINLLVRDAATTDRNDALFPYLRNFSPYAGHCWANGFATFPQGNDQESTSESMQFNSSLIHWGEVTGNKAIRDLGIYLYTTEQTAIEEYWLDIHHRNFPPTQQYSLVSRLWGNSRDNGTFWTADIAASYGIEMYPIHGGSLYLGHDTVYVKRLWNEIKANTGILSNEVNPNLWHDVMWEYQAFLEPAEAIKLYNSNPNRTLKFGVSDAQTYHWLHAMNALGRVDASITANYPIAAAFKQNNEITYVAHNYSNAPITVHFSTGYDLVVPARKMVTSKDSNVKGNLSTLFTAAYVGGSAELTATVTEGIASKVEFMDGNTSLGVVSSSPYIFTAGNLNVGVHSFYAKIFENEKFNTTNNVNVTVGEQLPFGGTPIEIPGTIEAGNYDVFEGGSGQNIAYLDLSPGNAGDYRMDEAVDVATVTAEGATVGWINAGEWLEYSVNVTQAGMYSFTFRSASGNASGGGPFHLELDGAVISSDISVPSTSTTKWDVWGSKTVPNISLTPGLHILRVAFSAGEFNLGKMTFARTGDIPYSYPTANAGTDIKVLLPQNSVELDGSGSSESASKTLTYSWSQVYGPSVAQFSEIQVAKPIASNLKEGMYKFKLTVKNTDLRVDEDELLVMVTSTANVTPTVSISQPENNTSYKAGTEITISANANDFDGTVQKVEFYQNNVLIASDNESPFSIQWTPAAGEYALTAKATDNGGAVGTSGIVNVIFSPVNSCTEASTEATQGSFTTGYKCTFETVNKDVTITWELLDEKVGVVAYLWTQTPFSEKALTEMGGKKYQTTLSNQTIGSTITVACKFAYSGGMSVTKYFTYVVGKNCGTGENDTEKPTNFTARLGNITQNSIELLVNATDNSGSVVYNVSYGTANTSVSANSGVEKSLILSGLTAATDYSISVSASDVTGNTAANNPIVLTAKTSTDTNTECSGSATEASQGSFSVGYKFSFVTSGNEVTVNFELLDNKSGVVAYLWNYTAGFDEIGMLNAGGMKFSKTLSGLTVGSVIKVACKFAFEGGMSVTKQLDYTVGKVCEGTGINQIVSYEPFFYPNPVQDVLHFELSRENNQLMIYDVLGNIVLEEIIPAKYSLNVSNFKTGIYFIKVQNNEIVMQGKVIKK